jgi:hypothetical protein
LRLVSLSLRFPLTDQIGFALAALAIGIHFWRARQMPAAQPAG